jgi:MarR family transcriptional regulator, lower aerobic nicotinate degradation pathway regulator
LTDRRQDRTDAILYGKPGHLIRRLQQIAVAIFMSEAKAFDITPVQYAALLAIDLHPGIDQTALASIVAFDKSTISAVLERLIAKDLVHRIQSENDRRTKVLKITPAGRQLLRRIEPAVQSAQDLILSPLQPGERKQFMKLMQRLVHINNQRSRVPLRARSRRA